MTAGLGRSSAGRAGNSGPRPAVSLRALTIGAITVPLYVWWALYGDIRGGGSLFGAAVLNFPVAVLLTLVAINQALKRWRPAWAFRPGELLTVYCMSAVTCGVASHGIVGGGLPSVMTYPFRFATAENGWRELIWPYMPHWLTVRDADALEGFWWGESSLYNRSVISAWLGPALWWASFMGAVMWVALCLNSIVRRRWSDEEKLPFPYVPVPILMVEERSGLFQSKAWWIGLGLAFSVGIWNAAGAILPSLPSVPMQMDFYPYLAHRSPWEAIPHRCSWLGWDPMYIGMAYLVPLDLLPSLIAFELFLMVEYVVSYHLGWVASIQGFPYIDQQTAGGLLALGLAFLWLDRRYFLQVLRRAFGLSSPLRDDGEEAFSYRTAVFGAILGLAYLWWFWARAGVPGWILVALLGLYFTVVMVLTRARAQVGNPTLDLSGAMPNMTLRTTIGPLGLGGPTLGMLNLLTPFLLGYQENNPVPAQLEALKMAENGRMERRRLGLALAIVVPLAVLCYFWIYLHLSYRFGLGTAQVTGTELSIGRSGADTMARLLRSSSETDVGGTTAMGVGFVFTLLLLYLKLRFQWWPLHPIAYPVANAWGMHYMTLIFLTIWAFKSVVLRYGGLRAHRTALPFFLGLLVGDLTAYTVQSIVSQIAVSS